MPPLTRRERARRVKKRNVFTQYGPVARKVLDALLDKYADEGMATIEADNVLKRPALHRPGQPGGAGRSFGGRPQYLRAVQTLERELYAGIRPPRRLSGVKNTQLFIAEYDHSTLGVPIFAHKTLPIMSNLTPVIKSIQDIMRQDSGVDGDAQRISQLTWLLFLKVFDALEEELELTRDDYPAPSPSHALAQLGGRPRRHDRRRAARLRGQPALPHAQEPAAPTRCATRAATWCAACSKTPTTT
jgi:hypothetical protein